MIIWKMYKQIKTGVCLLGEYKLLNGK